jgi:hypothetical protein
LLAFFLFHNIGISFRLFLFIGGRVSFFFILLLLPVDIARISD